MPHPAEILIGLVAFAGLYWVYKKVVPKHGAHVRRAHRRHRRRHEAAEQAQAEAKAALEQYQAQLQDARAEANAIREDAREQGAQIVAEMRGQAQAEASASPSRRKRQIEAERQQPRSSAAPARSAAVDRPGQPHRRRVACRTRSARRASSSASSPSSSPATSSPRRSAPPRGRRTLMQGIVARRAVATVQRGLRRRWPVDRWCRPLGPGRGPLRVTSVVDGQRLLRRALADPSREPAAKAGSPSGSSAARSATAMSSSPSRGRAALVHRARPQRHGRVHRRVQACSPAPSRAVGVDAVEDELFRFERIVAGTPPCVTPSPTGTPTAGRQGRGRRGDAARGQGAPGDAPVGPPGRAGARGRRFDRVIAGTTWRSPRLGASSCPPR
jgi:F0F1-type ATP synthase membrane subunit b/b'